MLFFSHMNPTIPINFVAVIVAALASVFLGFLWYGPLFGKPWMALMGFSGKDIDKAKQAGMSKTYVLMTLGTLMMSFVLAHNVVFASTYTNIHGVSAGLMAGFWNWIGFIVPIEMGAQLWGGKSWKLFPITAGYYLVSLSMMGVIHSLWR